MIRSCLQDLLTPGSYQHREAPISGCRSSIQHGRADNAGVSPAPPPSYVVDVPSPAQTRYVARLRKRPVVLAGELVVFNRCVCRLVDSMLKAASFRSQLRLEGQCTLRHPQRRKMVHAPLSSKQPSPTCRHQILVRFTAFNDSHTTQLQGGNHQIKPDRCASLQSLTHVLA